MEASFNTWTVIFLVVAVHGIVLSVIFFKREVGRALSNNLLGMLLLLFSVTLIDYVGYWTHYWHVYPHTINISGSFTFLFGPILFLYVVSLFEDYKIIRYRNLLHFLPFVVHLIFLLPFYLKSAPEKLAALNDSGVIKIFGIQLIALLKIIHLLIYSIWTILYTGYSSSRLKEGDHKFDLTPFHWTRIVSYCFLGFTVSFALYHILVATIDFNVEYDYMISFSMSFFIFTVGYVGYSNPDFITGYEFEEAKYQNSNLDSEEADKYLNRLLTYMNSEKPYVYGELRLKDVADQLDIPAHHLSQVINEKLDKNFNEFINSYRIDEAKRILSDPEKIDYKVLRVAFESGFNNKTSFNNSFKSEEGMTPTEYREHIFNGH